VSHDLIAYALAANEGEHLAFGEVTILVRVPAAASVGSRTHSAVSSSARDVSSSSRRLAAWKASSRELAAAHDAGTLGPETYATASRNPGLTWL
jgi:hypothetical protein